MPRERAARRGLLWFDLELMEDLARHGVSFLNWLSDRHIGRSCEPRALQIVRTKV
jgi:hypothetical protein